MFLNRVILIGRLTREPELRFTPAGSPVANFTLAVDRPFVNSQGVRETDFIRVVVWGKQAETCASYLTKGRLVAVEGRLQVRTYQAADGQTRQATEVVGETVRFLDRGREAAPATPSEHETGVPEPEEVLGEGEFVPGDDVPF